MEREKVIREKVMNMRLCIFLAKFAKLQQSLLKRLTTVFSKLSSLAKPMHKNTTVL